MQAKHQLCFLKFFCKDILFKVMHTSMAEGVGCVHTQGSVCSVGFPVFWLCDSSVTSLLVKCTCSTVFVTLVTSTSCC